MRRRHIHELLAIHGSCKIVNGSDHIERLGQNLQLFWFCTFSYFPLDGCKHYRPYQKKLTACLCLPHRRRLLGPWFSSWPITIPNINKGLSINVVGNFSGFLIMWQRKAMDKAKVKAMTPKCLEIIAKGLSG